jgi:hypothetical protein
LSVFSVRDDDGRQSGFFARGAGFFGDAAGFFAAAAGFFGDASGFFAATSGGSTWRIMSSHSACVM